MTDLPPLSARTREAIEQFELAVGNWRGRSPHDDALRLVSELEYARTALETAIREEMGALQRERDAWISRVEKSNDILPQWIQRAEKAETALREARDEKERLLRLSHDLHQVALRAAYERAAKVVETDGSVPDSWRLAAAIRALNP